MSFAPIARDKEPMPTPALMRFVSWPVITLTRLIQDLRVLGEENLPEKGPMIIAANHNGYLDPFIIGTALYEAGIPPTFVAKKELFVGPFDTILRGLGQMKVDRAKPDGFLEAVAQALDEGRAIVIFPEGTFTSDPDGWPMTPKSGIARLAELRPDVPIIPAAHWGNERLIHQTTTKPSFRRILHRSERVYVSFGPAVEMTGETYKEKATNLMRIIGKDVARLRRKLGRDAGDMPEVLAPWAMLPDEAPSALKTAMIFLGLKKKREKKES